MLTNKGSDTHNQQVVVMFTNKGFTNIGSVAQYTKGNDAPN